MVGDEQQPDVQPLEVEDEYRLSLDASGVEDESLLEQPGDIKFAITSYGADYSIDTILARLKSEAFYIPPFQRRFVWSQRHASRFIESLLMGLPVPGIFLYREPGTGRHLVVDGQQRLRTLQYFLSGVFLEKKFRLVGVRDEWNNKAYDELLVEERLRLGDCIIHSTIFQQDEPRDSQKSLYFVFERINSGGIRLSPQEIRNAIYDGAFLAEIRLMNEFQPWRGIFGEAKNARLKDQELILRFCAMMEQGHNYKRPMRDFLNEYLEARRDAPRDAVDGLRRVFEGAINVCSAAKGRNAFRPSGTLNAAIFEAIMLGVAARIVSKPEPINLAKFSLAYDRLIFNDQFLRACVRATADEASVTLRRGLSVAAFAET